MKPLLSHSTTEEFNSPISPQFNTLFGCAHECVGQSCFRPTFLCLAAAAAAACALAAALTPVTAIGRKSGR
eukprot:826283-Prorocentrum_minimum.AAC.2